ncbi:ParB/RepB/Spo0J family partition protein [Nocardia testacea]|uniref:ParB/RepB/Spo0J family partition protein n=1 Tax=Nocardia testacea TaxID=248551 RepID=UPI0033C5AE2A
MPAPKRTRPKPRGGASATNGAEVKSNVRLTGGLPSAEHSDITATVSKILSVSTSPGTPATNGSAPLERSTSAPLAAFAHRPDNPRDDSEYSFDNEDLKALGDTVDEFGILQPVTVCSAAAWTEHHPDDHFEDSVRYVVLMGNRRLAAARNLQLEELSFHQVDKLATPRAARESGLIENMHRTGLDPLREAGEMAAVIAETEETNREFAARLGISHTHVNNRLALLRLIDEFQVMVSEGALKPRPAVRIAALNAKDQRRLLKLGPPFVPARLSTAAGTTGGNTVSTRAVSIPKNSTPADIAKVLRSKLDPELLAEVRKLLDGSME